MEIPTFPFGTSRLEEKVTKENSKTQQHKQNYVAVR